MDQDGRLLEFETCGQRRERRVVESEEWRVESEVYETSGAPESNLGWDLD
jgi:predicted metalloprotease